MNTISQRFEAFRNVNLGAIPTLSRSVRGMKFGSQEIVDAFNKYVPKNEYAQNEKDEIIEWLLKQNYDAEIVLK